MTPEGRPPRRFFHRLRNALDLIGLAGLLWAVLCATPLAARALNWLSRDPAPPAGFGEPEVIVVLGGGGIPSESGLFRCFHGAVAARKYAKAEVIVALPADGDPETSAVGRMRDELVLRGVDRDRISLEHEGVGTHDQAVRIARRLAGRPQARVLLVTSAFHMRRATLTFRKAGLVVTCVPGESAAPETNMGTALYWRYYFWENLSDSVTFAREAIALAYYRLRGRI